MRHFWVNICPSSVRAANRQRARGARARPRAMTCRAGTRGRRRALVPGHALGGGLQSRDRGAREDPLGEVGGQREASLATRDDGAVAREHRDAPRAALARGVTNGDGDVQRVGEDLLCDAGRLEEAAVREERVEVHALLAKDVPIRTAAKTLMSWARTAFARVTRASAVCVNTGCAASWPTSGSAERVL